MQFETQGLKNKVVKTQGLTSCLTLIYIGKTTFYFRNVLLKL
jgi:hypothetical protein